jgi:quinol monooxygenase YgiN
MPTITVIARARAKAGFESQLGKAIAEIVEPSRAEEGCLKYSVRRSVEDPALFITIEEWSSKEAIDRHMSSAHVQELLQKLPAMLAVPPDIQAFLPVSI